MPKPRAETLLMFLVMVAVLACGVYLLSDFLRPKDSDDNGDCKNVASYKEKLKIADSPLSPRPPEVVTHWLCRIIDCDLEAGDRKSAREYINLAITQKLDGPVLEKVRSEESKVLIAAVRNANRKKESLGRLAAQYDKRPGESAAEAVKQSFDNDFQVIATEFCGIPFDPAACPEHAEDIAKHYRAKLLPAKDDVRLKKVVEEIEKRCLPPSQGGRNNP